MRTHDGPGDPEAYWRRRFFILGGGLAVLMLLAWMFGGGGGPSKQQSQSAAVRASAAARQAQGSLPSAAYGGPYGVGQSGSPSGSPSVAGSASPSATGTPSPSVSGKASDSASASASGKPSPSASPQASGAGGANRPCRAGSVVLTVVPSQPAYRSGERPRFSVYAVATSASGCRLRYGPGAVRLTVTRHGKSVWDSAACKAAHRGARTVRLDQGVPQEAVLSWDRKAAGRSCAGTLSHGASGTFEAVASADGFSSPARSFKLLR